MAASRPQKNDAVLPAASGGWWRDWPLWTMLLLAIALRFPFLDNRPPHSDEGVNGWFADQISANGFYKYDPTNYHGPFHYYLIFIFQHLLGRTLWALRLPAAILGVASIYLLTRFQPYVGRLVAYSVALLATVSPGMVYYSRFTFETDMLFFHLLSVLGYLRHGAERDRASLWMMGIGVAGMICVKEAFLLHLIVFAIAVFCLHLLERFSPTDAPVVEKKYSDRDADLAFGGAVLMIVTFYSGLFMYPAGVVDLFKPYATWFKTSLEGSGHDKPWWYWADMLRRYEWPATIGMATAAVVTVWTFFSLRLKSGENGRTLVLVSAPPPSAPLRLIGIYGIGLYLAYSLIPYKTPWLIIQFTWPFLFLFCAWLSYLSKRNGFIAGVVILLAAANVYPTIGLSFFRYTDEQEKYVYVQTFPALVDVYEKLHKRAAADPNTHHLPINIVMKANWPMPWILGDYTRVGYHSTAPPANPDAAFLLVDLSWQGAVESTLQNSYFIRRFRYSSYQEEVIAYFNTAIFAGMFPPDTPVYRPKPLAPGQGLLAHFYNNAQWQGDPVIKQVLPNINIQIGDPPPAGARPLPPPFGMVYSGEIFIPESGETTFFLSSDDGADLIIDGRRLISDLTPAGVRISTRGPGVFEAGWHPIQVHHYDQGGGVLVRLGWQLPSMKQEELILPERFRWTQEETKP